MDNIIVAVIMIALVAIPSELCNCKGPAGGENRSMRWSGRYGWPCVRGALTSVYVCGRVTLFPKYRRKEERDEGRMPDL